MAKYGKYQSKSAPKKGLNPIWRGIGCILIVIVPLLAYGLMVLSVPLIIATGRIPYQLLGRVVFPEWTYTSQVTSDFAIFIYNIDNLWVKVITFIVMVLLLTGISSLVYSMIYGLIGPARYTDTDAPPSKYKVKKYTR
jgi:hypothetical protein